MKATKMFVLRVWIMLMFMFLIAIPSVNQTTASAAVTKKYTATYVSTVDGDTAYLKVGKKHILSDFWQLIRRR